MKLSTKEFIRLEFRVTEGPLVVTKGSQWKLLSNNPTCKGRLEQRNRCDPHPAYPQKSPKIFKRK